MGIMGKRGRPCQYVTGWNLGPKICGSTTQNLIDKTPVCAYHAQFSDTPKSWPEV